MNAYITLLSSDNYLKGVIALSRCLAKVKSRYPLYCLIDEDISVATEFCLQQAKVRCIRKSRRKFGAKNYNIDEGNSHWNNTFLKLEIWNLVQFKKLVFVDCDMMVLHNIDHLFECLPFSAVCDRYEPNGSCRGLNSGLMVIEPDAIVASDLYKLMPMVIKQRMGNHLPVGDQDVINAYLPNWAQDSSLHIDDGYNMFFSSLQQYVGVYGYRMFNLWGGQIDLCGSFYRTLQTMDEAFTTRY